jgi:pimeloyl-ACP methyl ester carboxylesterase
MAVPIHFSHANGFPSEVYQPLFDALAPHPVSYLPVSGASIPGDLPSWQPLVDELLLHLQATHTQPVVGLGHSLGAVLMLRAAQQSPGSFARIIMLDPPLFGPAKRLVIRLLRNLGLAYRTIPIVKGALRRRDHFASREEAYTYWQAKSLFRHFPPESLHAYVAHGLEPAAEGGFHLRIPKSREANLFAGTPSVIGPALPKGLPSHLLYAAAGGVSHPREVRVLQRALPTTTFEAFDGGHMFPLEQPQALAERVKALLGEEVKR